MCPAYVRAESQHIPLGNSQVSLLFDEHTGNLARMVDEDSYVAVVTDGNKLNIWDLTIVGQTGELVLSSRGELSSSLEEGPDGKMLSLMWEDVIISSKNGTRVASINVVMEISLPTHSKLTKWDFSFTVSTAHEPIGVWEAAVLLPAGLADDKDGELFYPSGFGVSYPDPTVSSEGKISGTYPSGSVSLQYMALGSSNAPSGILMAALDPIGEAKNLDYAPMKESPNSGSFVRIKIFPEQAGVAIPPGEGWKAPYPIAVGIVTGVNSSTGRPLWFEAGTIYRDWALKNAHWTQQGTLAARQDEFPSWYSENSIWVNTHWQCHDIFNEVSNF